VLAEAGTDQQGRCQVSLTLTRDLLTDEWFADRIEFHLGGARNVTTFKCATPIGSAFSADFVAQIRKHLPQTTDAAVIVESESVVQTQRLVLGGVRVVAQQARHGVQGVIMRFKQALGAMQSVLLPKYRTEQTTREALDRSAAEALLYLLRPCLDLAEVELDGESEVLEQVARRLEGLAENKDELRFFVYLLRRFVENAPVAEVSAPRPHREGLPAPDPA